jgi:hypothetical protein
VIGVVFLDGYGKMSGNRHAWITGMGDPTIDKRSERTREAIETAFLGLIERPGYDLVGVGDICSGSLALDLLPPFRELAHRERSVR